MNIKVCNYSAWYQSSSDFEQVDEDYYYKQSLNYELQVLNKRQTRRMSELTRLTVDKALQTLETQPIDHLIHVSQHGELFNSTVLIDLINDNEVLSPMKFSQSVHNTAAGQITTLLKKQFSSVSIGCEKQLFLTGLLSAQGYLDENPGHKVLLLVSDVKTPERFQALVPIEENRTYVASFIISSGDSHKNLPSRTLLDLSHLMSQQPPKKQELLT